MITILLNILTLLLSTNIQLYTDDSLTYETLRSRTPDVLIIEEIHGTVIDGNGNGECYGSYINYSNMNVNPGDEIITYCIYNPENNYEDDILYRIDITPSGDIYIN